MLKKTNFIKATQKNLLKPNKSEQDIKSLSTELEAARKRENLQIQVSDTLLEDTNKKLKNALDKGNFAGAKITQRMIEVVIKSK